VREIETNKRTKVIGFGAEKIKCIISFRYKKGGKRKKTNNLFVLSTLLHKDPDADL